MTKSRGSELLAHKWTEADLAKLLDIEHQGVTLARFLPKGIPNPDGGWGVWHVVPGAVSDFIAVLLKMKKLPGNIWITPIGVPPGPETFEVGFTAGSAGEL